VPGEERGETAPIVVVALSVYPNDFVSISASLNKNRQIVRRGNLIVICLNNLALIVAKANIDKGVAIGNFNGSRAVDWDSKNAGDVMNRPLALSLLVGYGLFKFSCHAEILTTEKLKE